VGGNSSRIQFIIASATGTFFHILLSKILTVGNSIEMSLKLINRSNPYRIAHVSSSGSRLPERTILCLAAQDAPTRTAAEIIVDWYC
jgi:hypothetical protein